MRITSDPNDKNIIRSFEPGEIHLRDAVVHGPLIISADAIITDWQPPAVNEFSINDFARALDLNPEVILFGTGSVQQFPDIALMTEILQRGVAMEVMSTRAACRTFNVLVSEQRAVVAVLLID